MCFHIRCIASKKSAHVPDKKARQSRVFFASQIIVIAVKELFGKE